MGLSLSFVVVGAVVFVFVVDVVVAFFLIVCRGHVNVVVVVVVVAAVVAVIGVVAVVVPVVAR